MNVIIKWHLVHHVLLLRGVLQVHEFLILVCDVEHVVAVVVLLILLLFPIIIVLICVRLCVRVAIAEAFAVGEFEEFEGLPILFSHIVCLRQAVQVVDKMHHFFILLIIVERDDGNAIINLESKTVYAVVNDDYVLEVPALEDSQVLHIVALLSEEAMLSVEAVSNELVVRVHVVKDGVGVDLVARRERDHLEVLVCFFEAFHDIWSDINTRVHSLFIWKVYLENDVGVLRLDVVHAVN